MSTTHATSTVRATLRELDDLAVNVVGGCVAIAWRTERLPGAPPFRLVRVLFRSRWEARLFTGELRRRGWAHLPACRIREVTVADELSPELGLLRGWAAAAIISPDPEHPEWAVAAPTPISRQPGVARQARIRELLMERGLERDAREGEGVHRPTDRLDDAWAMLIPDDAEHDERGRLVQEPEVSYAALAELGALERELTARWRRDPRYFQTVDEALAYIRRKDEAKRRPFSTDDDAKGWLGQARRAGLLRQRELDADQAEVAAALATPRRGRKHAEDADWQELGQALRARGVLRHLYADTRPRPRRPRREA